mmetsp:Transcript_30940/g.60748  ORF Transcript_30940/g.60748 Transcript_30940/m.60748 type:complete len:205 (+) Transcript_30940:1619-2233(+)
MFSSLSPGSDTKTSISARMSRAQASSGDAYKYSRCIPDCGVAIGTPISQEVVASTVNVSGGSDECGRKCARQLSSQSGSSSSGSSDRGHRGISSLRIACKSTECGWWQQTGQRTPALKPTCGIQAARASRKACNKRSVWRHEGLSDTRASAPAPTRRGLMQHLSSSPPPHGCKETSNFCTCRRPPSERAESPRACPWEEKANNA